MVLNQEPSSFVGSCLFAHVLIFYLQILSSYFLLKNIPKITQSFTSENQNKAFLGERVPVA